MITKQKERVDILIKSHSKMERRFGNLVDIREY